MLTNQTHVETKLSRAAMSLAFDPLEQRLFELVVCFLQLARAGASHRPGVEELRKDGVAHPRPPAAASGAT